MTMGIRSNKRTLDPKQCYELWARAGSVYKVPSILKNEYNIFNEKTGLPYTPQGIWNSARTYVIEHMVEARKLFEEVWKANGRLATDADWYKFVLEKAKNLPPRKFDAFVETHNYLKPYVQAE